MAKKHSPIRFLWPTSVGLFSVFGFVRRNVVLCAALALCAVTACIVPPDKAYLSYFDWKTLACLFCTLAVVSALKNIRFFTILAHRIVRYTGNTRITVLVLCCITCVGSMFVMNDMALLAFLPLGYFALSSTGREKYIAFAFAMQNLAANLGGMLTPFGNPQNLYLYTKYNISNGEFFSIMLPFFLLSMGLIILCCLCIKKEPLTVEKAEYSILDSKRAVLYLVLFALCIAIVFRAVPYWVGLVAIPVALLFADRKALAMVDYPLLLTFAAFFVFSGNMARIGAVNELLSGFLRKDTLLCSVTFSQFISNVPAAILLSQFTQNYRELLIGVNIGSAGTLVASLASLITLREYMKHMQGSAKKYLLLFSALNFSFLVVLILFTKLFFQ